MKTKSAPAKGDFKVRYSIRSRDLPATQGMLHLVRGELKADIRELRGEMKAGFSQIDARFSGIDSRFEGIDSKLERVLSEVARIGTLVEEQNSRNQVVLEGLTGLWQRQDRVEGRMNDVEKTVRSIGRSRA